ncbi:MAG TPA: Nif3-like dinuclear metal center hexameric protein [Spirochaetota bacterium]|nr:Nif3-like dinuclear metal center hexameric protein [Spirochaetota bacterium]HPF04449.1 Nif3-like dinuclear metal center hexameric protein [Spirochaetota bacterium]HPJ40779.1 Nif3-like dinuclear metal center hexameric protein [Spirochaetota bacterium]HRX45962.1 Nif3-like dinuclear metal center hexameric protein [Spirochaetota bacterium]
MEIKDILKNLEERFPSWIQEEYDNTGPQVIFHDEEVKNIYICLDADEKTIDDALKNNCNLIISHHPMIFRSLKSINNYDSRSKAIIKLIDERISLFSLHTNFDKIMFSYLSESAGFPGGELLLKKGLLDGKEIGYGTLVKLNTTLSSQEVISRIKEKLNLDYLIYSGDISQNIDSIAFINGAGGSSIEKVISLTNPDCIVTGDVGYHSAKYAIDNNVFIIDAGHFGTENIFKKLLAESVIDIITVGDIKSEIIVSEIEKNPFKVY